MCEGDDRQVACQVLRQYCCSCQESHETISIPIIERPLATPKRAAYPNGLSVMARIRGRRRDADVIVIGAGAAGLAAANILLEHGIDYLKTLSADLNGWLEKHEYDSIEQMQGSMSQKNVAHPAAFERANYMKVLNSYSVK